MVAYVLYIQTTAVFPSWTSRVRVPSPLLPFPGCHTSTRLSGGDLPR